MTYSIHAAFGNNAVTVSHADGRSIFLQGDSARRFLSDVGWWDYRTMKHAAIERVCDEYFEALAEKASLTSNESSV